MSLDIKFNISPIPASRPRVTRWSTYYNKKYTAFREQMIELTKDSKAIPLEGNIYAQLVFNIPIPKSWPKWKKATKIGAYCDNNADIDNYCKAILDSLNGIYYEDDRQIVMLKATMYWSETPNIQCNFTPMDSQSEKRLSPLPAMSPYGEH